MVDSASNRNEYLGGKGGRCIGLKILPPSFADCLEIWEPQPPGTLWACPGLEWDCFTFTPYEAETILMVFGLAQVHTKDGTNCCNTFTWKVQKKKREENNL